MENGIITVSKETEKSILKVKKELARVEKGYLSIVGDLQKLRDVEAYKELGYKSMSELAVREFSMAKSTLSTLLKIADRLCENYKLPEWASNCGFAKIAEIIRVGDDNKMIEVAAGATEKTRDELRAEVDEILENSTAEPTEKKKRSKSVSIKIDVEVFNKVVAIINEGYGIIDVETDTITIIKEKEK